MSVNRELVANARAWPKPGLVMDPPDGIALDPGHTHAGSPGQWGSNLRARVHSVYRAHGVIPGGQLLPGTKPGEMLFALKTSHADSSGVTLACGGLMSMSLSVTLRRLIQRRSVPKAARQARLRKRTKRILSVVGLVVAVGILAASVYYAVRLVRGTVRGSQVAAAFTRVGGPTRVETAVDASRFWLTPPRFFVTTPAYASQQVMFEAAQWAMANDAPLLFSSRSPKRKRLFRATIHHWRITARAAGSPRPQRINVGSLADVNGCPAIGYRAYASRLSTFVVPSQPLPVFLPVRSQRTLAPVVIFAVYRGQGDAPDVATGLALAAHLAWATAQRPATGPAAARTTTGHRISLVVLPRYLEADLALERQLRHQHELVKGGVVLGSAGILSEDTHALLRQLLIATDQQSVLGQIQTNLGLIGTLLIGLLALIPVGTAAAVGTIVAMRQIFNILPPSPSQQQGTLQPPIRSTPPAVNGGETVDPSITAAPPPGNTTPIQSDWLKALADDRDVTIWLRSGLAVSGTMDDKKTTTTVLRLSKATFKEPESKNRRRQPPAAKRAILIAVEDIELITVDSS